MADKDNYHQPNRNLDADLQAELDAALGDQSLEDLLQSEESQEKPEQGERKTTLEGDAIRTGTVISIQKDDIFVDLGGRSEGLLPAAQFQEEPLPVEGDRIDVVIEGYDADEGLMKLSRQGAAKAAKWETLEEGQVLEGRVTGHNKGGLEMDIQGIRAFMPISQVERFRVDDLSEYMDKKLRCMVVEAKPHEQNLVVSRRELLDAEAREEAEKMFKTLQEGDVVDGVVRSIMPYGVFVDIGGVDGLLHISDMSYSRVEKPEDIVKEGEQVSVKVLKIDRDERKLSLGLKQVKPDPWDSVQVKYPVDSIVSGRVTKLVDFGAFLELEDGVEGLIPIGEMSHQHVHNPAEVVNEGDVISVRVISVEPDRKRIGLSIKRAEEDPWQGASVRWAPDSVVEGVVTRVADFGAFVQVAPGVEGLVHISELSDQHVRSVSEVVREGDTVKAKVLDVDEERRRMSLSIKQALSGGDIEAPSRFETKDKPRKSKRPLRGGLD